MHLLVNVLMSGCKPFQRAWHVLFSACHGLSTPLFTLTVRLAGPASEAGLRGDVNVRTCAVTHTLVQVMDYWSTTAEVGMVPFALLLPFADLSHLSRTLCLHTPANECLPTDADMKLRNAAQEIQESCTVTECVALCSP